MDFLMLIIKWTEVWATLLPILIWIIRRPKKMYLLPVKIYLIIAFILSFWADLAYLDLLANNHFIYTIISVCRLFFFLWFFSLMKIPTNTQIPFIVFSIISIIIILDFSFREDFLKAFSSTTFSLEGIILLIFCILFFLKKLKSDEISNDFDSSLFIVIGLAVYEAVCFPVFLFFKILIDNNSNYAANMWDAVHNIVYIVFCLFIARAFYGSSRRSVK
jgi:hypothetical protein